VPASIQQHVAEGIPDLFRRREQPDVIAIGEHASRAPRDTIDGAGETRADCHHPATERCAVASFDDQVRVIPL